LGHNCIKIMMPEGVNMLLSIDKSTRLTEKKTGSQ
jgi:hypothetical protein